MKALSLTSAALLALASTAIAATEMDTDGDGAYSFNEVLAAYPTLTEEPFISIDADASGSLNDEELAAALESGVLPSEG